MPLRSIQCVLLILIIVTYFSSFESYLTVGSIEKTEFVCFSNLTKCTVKSRLCFIKVISPHRIPMSERYIQISTCSLKFRIQCWILITVLHKMRQPLRSFWKMATRKRQSILRYHVSSHLMGRGSEFSFRQW